MSGDACYRRPSDVRMRLVGDEGVAIRQQAGEVIVLNEVGARILELAGQGMPLADIARSLSEMFDVAEAAAAEDVTRFLDDLQRRGLLEPDAADRSVASAGPGTRPGPGPGPGQGQGQGDTA